MDRDLGNVRAGRARRQRAIGLVLPEWIEAGILGAIAVATVCFVRDSLLGDPLRTPSVLGAVMMHGLSGATQPAIPGAAALFNAIHFAGWMGLGLLASWIMRRAEDDARWRLWPGVFLVFAVLSVSAIDVALTFVEPPPLHLWLGGTTGLLVMSGFLIWRHPGAVRR